MVIDAESEYLHGAVQWMQYLDIRDDISCRFNRNRSSFRIQRPRKLRRNMPTTITKASGMA
jgi:hypothetical protein